MDKKSIVISKKSSNFAHSIKKRLGMKKILCGAICLLFLFSGCKNEVQTVLGSYSYKTSVLESVLPLPIEVGQLEVVNLHNEDSVLLLFNELGGPAYQTKGKIEQKNLCFAPFTRVINIGLRDCPTTITGSAALYDNTIVFDYQYSIERKDTTYNAHVQSIAKKNNE